jgi:Mor family transcriptional regulator
MQDRVRDGTQCLGEKSPVAKLTAADVIEIRRRYDAGVSQAELVRTYSVGASQVNRIVKRKSWVHLP